MSKGSGQQSLGAKIFRILSGFEIAVVCLVLLFLLTFFGTIEQQWIGLYQTIKKYFDLGSFFVVPQLSNGKYLPLPLPGAYWVMVVLFINMTLGGLIRVRKNWKKFGVLISHFSILFMLLAGGVSSFKKREGNMLVYEGQQSDYAQSLFDPSIEVFEYLDDGSRAEPLVVDEKALSPLDPEDSLTVELEGMPFTLSVSGFKPSTELSSAKRGHSGHQEEKVVDGFFLKEVERDLLEELNLAGCYVTVKSKSGEVLQELVLWEGNAYPVSISYEGKRYGFILTGKVWPMPYKVELYRALGEYYPGTRKARWFQSDIVKVDGENRENYKIVMNEPMRHGGYTLYQASWTPPPEGGTARTGFAVVNNPSDKWPEWSLYAATVGLLIHFGMMLFKYVGASSRKVKEAKL